MDISCCKGEDYYILVYLNAFACHKCPFFYLLSFSSLVLLVSVSLSFLSVLFVQSFYLFTSILPSFTYAFHILLYSPYQTRTKYQLLCTSGNNTGSKNFKPMPQMLLPSSLQSSAFRSKTNLQCPLSAFRPPQLARGATSALSRSKT
jgi:hypothetical protein